MKELLQQLYDAFEKTTRYDGKEIWVLKDDSPKWMTNVIYEAHLGNIPSDYVYETLHDLIRDLLETEDDLEEFEAESSIWVADWLRWLSDDLGNIDYITQVQDDFGLIKDGYTLIQMAHNRWLNEVKSVLLNTLKEVEDD